jgi:hypothetical protein
LVDELAGVTSKDKRSNPFSLDAMNFLLAEVQGVLGPFLNAFLIPCPVTATENPRFGQLKRDPGLAGG